jgi:hypothetical protein
MVDDMNKSLIVEADLYYHEINSIEMSKQDAIQR